MTIIIISSSNNSNSNGSSSSSSSSSSSFLNIMLQNTDGRISYKKLTLHPGFTVVSFGKIG